jgi:hypothetical protein
MNINHPLGQDGVITKMAFYADQAHAWADQDIHGITLSVWRRNKENTAYWDMIGESQDILLRADDTQVLHIVQLDTPIAAQKGDCFGFYSGDNKQLFGIRQGGGAALYTHGHQRGSKVGFGTTGVTYAITTT